MRLGQPRGAIAEHPHVNFLFFDCCIYERRHCGGGIQRLYGQHR